MGSSQAIKHNLWVRESQAADGQKLQTQSQTLLLNILPRYLLPASTRDLSFDTAQPLFWHCTTDCFLVQLFKIIFKFTHRIARLANCKK